MRNLDVSIRLRADGRGLVGQVGGAKRSLNELRSATAGAGTAAKRTARSLGAVGRSAVRLERNTIGVRAGLLNIKNTLLTLGFLEAAREVKTTTADFRGFDQALKIITGSSAGAARELAFVRKTADDLGLVNRDLAKSFVLVSGSAKGTKLAGQGVRDIFAAFTRASVGFQSSNEQIKRGFTALGQIVSKGVVSMEEIRQQLSEALPGAVQIAARAMGLSGKAFQDAVAKGEILAEDFIPRLAAQLRKEIPDGVVSMNAAFNESINILDDFKREIGERGAFDALGQAALAGATAIKTVSDNLDTLIPIAEAAVVVIGVRLPIALGTAAVTAFAKANLGAIVGLRIMANVSKVAAARMALLGVVATGLRAAFFLLGGIPGIVALVAFAAFKLGTATDAVTEATNKELEASRQLREELEKETGTVEEATKKKVEATAKRLNHAIAIRGETRALLEQALAEAEKAAGKRREAEARPGGGFLGVPAGVVSAQVADTAAAAKVDGLKARLKALDEEIANDNASLSILVNRLDSVVEAAGGGGGAAGAVDGLAARFKSLISALDPAAAAQAKFTAGAKTLKEALAGGLIKSQEEHQALLDKLRREVLPTATELTNKFVGALGREGAAARLSADQRAGETAVQQALNAAKQRGIELSAVQIAQIRQTAEAEAAKTAAVNKSRAAQKQAAADAVDEFNRIFRTARENVQNTLADTINDLLGGSINSVKKFWKSFAAIGRQAISQTLAALVFSGGKLPAASKLSPLASGFLSGLGLKQKKKGQAGPPAIFAGQSGQAGQQSQPGQAAQPLTKTQSFFKDFGQGAGEIFKPITQGLQKVFKPLFGNLGKSLGKAFGGAQLGGAVAGIAGALGIGLSNSGAQLGGALGSVFGPAGSLVGSIAGGVLGKVFGKTPKGSATIGAGAGGGLDVTSSFGRGDGREAGAIKLADSVISGLEQVAARLGGNLTGTALGSIGSKGKKFVFDPSGQGRVKGVGVEKFASQEEAVKAVLKEALAGGAVAGLSEAVRRALKSSPDLDRALSTALKVKDLELFVQSIEKPFRAAFDDFERQSRERLKIAREFGFDVLRIERLNADQRKKLLASQLSAATGSIKNLLADLRLGGRAEGSALERRAALLAEQASLRAKADAGDTSVLDRLAQVSGQLLDVSKEAFGSTAGFAGDRADTVSLLESLLSRTEDRIRASSEAAQKAAQEDKTVDALKEANSSLDDITLGQGRMLAELRGVRAGIATLGRAGNSGPTLVARGSARVF